MLEAAAMHNVSCASGAFAQQLRSTATVMTSLPGCAPASHGQRRLQCNALTTYNRRMGARSSVTVRPGRRRAVHPVLGGSGLMRITSPGAWPRFNALQRLASQALSPTDAVDNHHSVQAAVGAVAEPASAGPAQPSIQLTSAFATGSGTHPQLSSVGSPTGGMGFATDFTKYYVLGDEIGNGSFGTVYVATAVADGESIAVKVLPKEPSMRAARSRRGSGRNARGLHRAKILKEVMVLQKLQHSGNTVRLQGVYEDYHNVYIAMEDCKGGDLEQLLDSGSCLTERQAALVMHEVLTTLAACHEADVYHGDVKPANFMLAQPLDPSRPLNDLDRMQPGTWLKAIDFGCAQPVTPGAALTRKTGTPIFMAPEVFIGNYGVEADLWAAGMMAYQLLAGRFPYWPSMESLNTTSLEQVMQAVVQQDAPLDYGVWTEVSPQCLDFMRAALSRDPAQRITAAAALRHEWFRDITEQDHSVDRSVSGNIVPLARSMSDALRLRMCSAQLSRAASRQLSHSPGLCGAELAPCSENLHASC